MLTGWSLKGGRPSLKPLSEWPPLISAGFPREWTFRDRFDGFVRFRLKDLLKSKDVNWIKSTRDELNSKGLLKSKDVNWIKSTSDELNSTFRIVSARLQDGRAASRRGESQMQNGRSGEPRTQCSCTGFTFIRSAHVEASCAFASSGREKAAGTGEHFAVRHAGSGDSKGRWDISGMVFDVRQITGV
ncbi:hypothetical protein PoB_002379200 [Plakobranchus ocellatus]|uniref:Uncharacterized protein n=1 Tax=Plakobranchus ocellatus TaxID=259542 RepID=A0AAV3ZRK1_9GAST|nr:hypothetical protein PoB_002379200 [Plakobranchus ocellatus]